VLRFVAGVRGERQGAVTKAQIQAWFSGTPGEFVNAALLDAIIKDELRVGRTSLVRRTNSRSVYELTDIGRAALRATNGNGNREQPNIALGLRLILEAAEKVEEYTGSPYTRPGRGIARTRQVDARWAAAAWIRSLPEGMTQEEAAARLAELVVPPRKDPT
jgi:hypothetical protein